MYITSLVGFFALGFFSGFRIKKRGLLIGISLSFVYLILAFILRLFHLTSATLLHRLMVILRIAILNVSAILGVNFASKKALK